ncbi:MAG TPA: DinB family protein [Methylomirabilota bacterium]|nr:DinB family protein [Methylomirabilota bacterium]
MSDRHKDWPARLRLHPTAFVAPGATVVGEVTLGEHASVWFGTVVRGDGAPITVGAYSNLQDLTVVHVDEDAPTSVGARVTVGHRAIIHGCTIEDDCLIGMGAIVLSRSRVGAGSFVGAGALVTEGQVIPPGSLAVGSPARVLGPVKDRHKAAIADGTKHYAELAQAYLAKGFARPFPSADSAPGITASGQGPMTYAEWGGLIATLAEAPDWVADRIDAAPANVSTRPAPGCWSAHEVLGHLRDGDRDVFLPRLEVMLTQRTPTVPYVDLSERDRVAGYAREHPRDVLADWRALRKRLIARLAPLGRDDWARVGVHSSRGSFPLGEMVRGWVEHDLSHRRQLALALGLAP